MKNINETKKKIMYFNDITFLFTINLNFCIFKTWSNEHIIISNLDSSNFMETSIECLHLSLLFSSNSAKFK